MLKDSTGALKKENVNSRISERSKFVKVPDSFAEYLMNQNRRQGRAEMNKGVLLANSK
jgi:hypothetical protein